ncbi:hypothetical protein BCR32DRAFT_140520 [Anaeromyces robustus]|uniref:Up-regulated during septation protein 1 domain-containing protein n=1 Tax=Anaeromyces robustus TaxID=1754192 RepID=A0A1Y1VQZ6_9FUNG|nr:hypothetical protein BCR32DRAFT_140520 [Anaeromyces robustus]|eukprot:ORX63456.1 hypothetical protein BCR32DRAFT_140520 [Anaeromyces robustus]
MSDRRERKDSESRRSRSKDRHHDDKSRSGSRHRSKSRHRERDKSRSRKDRDGERSRTLDRYERERSRMERDRDRDREKSRTIERDRSRTIDRERDRRDRERDRDRDRDRSRTLDRERHHKERSHHTRKMSSPADISILKNKNTNPNDFLGPSPLNMTSNAENVSAIKGYSHAIATFPRNSSLSNIKTDQMTKIDNKVPFSPGVNGLDTSFTFPRRKEDPFPASASPISAGPLRPGEAESNSSAESSTTAVIQENKPIFPVRQESKGITRTGRSRANTQTSETKKDGSMSISEMKSALMKEPKKLGGPVSLLAALKVGDGLHMYKSSDTINPSFHIQRDITVMKDLLENALTVSTNCYILNKDTANTLKEKIKKYSDQISSIKTKIQSESSIQESVINIVKNGSKDSQTQKSAKEKLSSTNRKLDKLAADLFKVNDKLRISQNDFFSHVIGVYNWELERMKQTGDNFSVSDDDMIKKLKDELEENVCIVKEQQDELDASKALILQLQAQLELKKQDANDSMSTLDRKHVDDIRQQIKELEKQRKEIQTLESKFNESTVSPTNSWTGSLGRNRNLKRMRELEDEITELRDQALEQNDTIDKLKAENSDLKAQLVSIEIIYQSLPSSLSSSRHFTVEDLEKTIKLLLEDNEEQFKRIKSLTKKLRDTEADNEMQQKRMNNLQSLQSPISPRTTSLKKSNNNNNDKDDTDTQLINEVCNLNCSR